MWPKLIPAAFVMPAILVLVGCGQPSPHTADGNTGTAPSKQRLVIFHAASLARPFQVLETHLESTHPGLDVIRESSSSRLAIRKVTETGRDADIVASADDGLLRDLMLPGFTDWISVFARNRVVIAYTQRSRYRSEINAGNWYDILLRDDVNFGYAAPDMAPVGYRTLLCWKLADRHYADQLAGRSLFAALREACPEAFIRPHCNELIPLLESMTLDYTFQYRSVALQHHLEWLKLPDAIDLGNESLAEDYATVSIDIAGPTRNQTMTRTGCPILYGLTIPRDAPNQAMAIAFLELLFSAEGQTIMEENFQEPVTPPLCHHLDAAPASLRSLMRAL